MINNILSSIKEDRAKFVRDLAYIRENAEEDLIAERVEKAEKYMGAKPDKFESYVEAVTILESMKEDYSDEDNAELQRILESTEDMTFDQMIGIE